MVWLGQTIVHPWRQYFNPVEKMQKKNTRSYMPTSRTWLLQSVPIYIFLKSVETPKEKLVDATLNSPNQLLPIFLIFKSPNMESSNWDDSTWIKRNATSWFGCMYGTSWTILPMDPIWSIVFDKWAPTSARDPFGDLGSDGFPWCLVY